MALTLVAIAPPAYTAIGYDANAAKEWTTEQAYDWILRNVPAGSRVRLEGSLAIKLPATYKTSYVKQLRLDGIEQLRRHRHPVPGRLVAVLRPVFREPRAVSRRVRGLPANLRADRRSRAVQGDRLTIPVRSCIILKVKR